MKRNRTFVVSREEPRATVVKRASSIPLLLLVLVCASTSAVPLTEAASHSPLPTPFSPRLIRNWIQARCGGGAGSAAVWVYEGALYDPIDGRQIAAVEGLELVRQLVTTSSSSTDTDDATDNASANPQQQQQQQQKRYQDLKARNIQGDYSTTLLSRRLFCYQAPQQSLNRRTRLLDSIRLRPNAPLRKIPPQQAVALYDVATTYTSRKGGRELVLHTEFPNGKCIWGVASSPSSSSSASVSTVPTSPGTRETSKKKDDTWSSMDFVVFSRPNHNQDVPPPPLSPADESTQEEDSAVVVASPRRSQLIQFGAASPSQQTADQQGKFGARESYSFTMQPSSSPSGNNNIRLPLWWPGRRHSRNDVTENTSSSSCLVKYTRYGEGPPWYGSGKYCMLELRGRKVTSVAEAPPLAASIAAERVPGFLSVDAPIVSDVAAKRAIDWFRQGNLQFVSDDEPDDDDLWNNGGGGSLQKLAHRVKKRGSNVFQRVRAASVFEAGGTS